MAWPLAMALAAMTTGAQAAPPPKPAPPQARRLGMRHVAGDVELADRVLARRLDLEDGVDVLRRKPGVVERLADGADGRLELGRADVADVLGGADAGDGGLGRGSSLGASGQR